MISFYFTNCFVCLNLLMPHQLVQKLHILNPSSMMTFFCLMSNPVHLKVWICWLAYIWFVRIMHVVTSLHVTCYCCSCLGLLHLHSCLFHWSNFGQWVDFGICGCGEWFYLIQLFTVDRRFIEIPGNCINKVLFHSLSSNKTLFNTGLTSCKSY